jgi:hypothetical protein
MPGVVGEGDLELAGEPATGLELLEPGVALLALGLTMLMDDVAMFLPFVVESNAAVVPGQNSRLEKRELSIDGSASVATAI